MSWNTLGSLTDPEKPHFTDAGNKPEQTITNHINWSDALSSIKFQVAGNILFIPLIQACTVSYLFRSRSVQQENLCTNGNLYHTAKSWKNPDKGRLKHNVSEIVGQDPLWIISQFQMGPLSFQYVFYFYYISLDVYVTSYVTAFEKILQCYKWLCTSF